ncbi:MAG: hypothetical protein A3I24_01375 [Candidatus Harrisonbacteria bacterium RIFCSPLOWO2_02_FULL_41_13b]|uniref:PD-(D/E)XK endonuclease-like domain-containing protein n=1 Tax=Candidatus Harrisonbacteria bacterium RIFCSPLOWO2_02_FULL_41_13b TaxID=1798409 RepID=A0A1G1ZTK2_9BACT|nr:MAG: hypothetical protein A3J53_02020 [Candidatus Harrisonbacteria bacterium RIFCSPHIGHO2_02_FULL_40_20]OGY67809.1 MAG: hypothetical protein A3I24_01375 [Candidatus Harrisonbacteria bacterium RIFCSPLOWO2_02_FULL_41_13b]
MPIKDGKIRLSPSTLNVFLECPKCFWLGQAKEIHRPRGIFPSLPGGMDLLIKKYFDKYRAIEKLPPEIDGKIDCGLFLDQELLNKWRSWRSALVYEDPESGAVLSGMLDDLGVKDAAVELKKTKGSEKQSLFGGEAIRQVQGKGEFVPLDYKTRGFDVKEGGESYYQNQLNCYGLLLRENDMKPAGHAYLIYYIPKEISEKGMVRFDIVPKRVEINPDQALKVLRDAAKLIQGPMPARHSTCEYCAWGNDFLTE